MNCFRFTLVLALFFLLHSTISTMQIQHKVKQEKDMSLDKFICSSDKDCKYSILPSCIDAGERTPCKSSSKACACYPKDFDIKDCDDLDDCKSGICMQGSCVPHIDLDKNGNPKISSEVCIGAHLLQPFTKHDLIFDKHQQAKVLCDYNYSCATPGHMVEFNGSVMMMANYCRMLKHGCEWDIMLVNSPKWKRSLRVNSRTDGLQFTAFAARYATSFEEHVLKTAVHMGL